LETSPAGSRVLDVGGNIGYFTFLSAANGPVTVDAFEPNPKNRLRFCESLQLNQWLTEYDPWWEAPSTKRSKVNLYAMGVGAEEGFFEFVENGNPGQGSFGDNKGNFNDKQASPKNGFRVITLDQFAEERGWFGDDDGLQPDIALLKVDVEGLEYKVIEGAQKLLQAKIIRNIFMEVSARTHAERKANEPAIRYFLQAGYRLHQTGGGRGPEDDFNFSQEKYSLVEKVMNLTLAEKGKQLNLWWTL